MCSYFSSTCVSPILGSANEAPHTPHSLHPHLVQEHLSSNVIVASSMPTPIHNGQICKYQQSNTHWGVRGIILCLRFNFKI